MYTHGGKFMKNAIVLAAGKGTRMHSNLPKVLHEVCGMPMVEFIIRQIKKAGADRIVTVTGYQHELVEKTLKGQCEFALQEPLLGTGHAVQQATQLEGEDGVTIVANGDVPCVRVETYAQLFEAGETADMVVLTMQCDDPKSYGRIVRDANGEVEKIVEFKDCTEEEKLIKEVNTGMYAFQNQKLFTYLKELKNDNAQGEYYITDLIEIMRNAGCRVKALMIKDLSETQGTNDPVELAIVNKTMQRRINTEWMKKGVTFIDPENSYVGVDVSFGRDVVIYPNTFLYGKTVIKDEATILPNSTLYDTVVEEGAIVDASKLIDCTVSKNEQIGPYVFLYQNEPVKK